MNSKNKNDSGQETSPAPSPEATTSLAGTPMPDVASARSVTELEQALAIMERRSSDIIALPTVQEGYMAHGHPASLGFQNMNTMTKSRLKKKYPLFTTDEPLFRILWLKGRNIVAEEILAKYKARLEGKSYDYAKEIDRRFELMFAETSRYNEVLAEIEYDGGESDA